MNGYWTDLVLIAVLIVLNALFAGSEIALISLRESQVRRMRRGAGSSRTRLVRLVQEPNRFLATIQIGITLAGFLASATAAVSCRFHRVGYSAASRAHCTSPPYRATPSIDSRRRCTDGRRRRWT